MEDDRIDDLMTSLTKTADAINAMGRLKTTPMFPTARRIIRQQFLQGNQRVRRQRGP
jgi:hypothetical protein